MAVNKMFMICTFQVTFSLHVSQAKLCKISHLSLKHYMH